MSKPEIKLTSSEIGALWDGYMGDSMSVQVLGFMLNHIEDPEIKAVIQYAYDISIIHLEKLVSIFEEEQYAKPHGFTENDVNISAPNLFSDIFCLSYLNHMSKLGMTSYSVSVSMSYREDICNYFLQALNESGDLYQQMLGLLKESMQGIHILRFLRKLII